MNRKRVMADSHQKRQTKGVKPWSLFGEFDSGSERTLAAWLRHASRTEYSGSNIRVLSGERVRNTWIHWRSGE